MNAKPPKPKKCPVCKNSFTPARAMQKVCGIDCAKIDAERKREKAEQKERADSRRKIRARLDELKTVPELLKEAQIAFNRYIRLRDQGKPCICCGKPLSSGSALTGGDYDAGHYRSTGSAGHLRFHEDNCHAQRKQCNQWGAGRAVDYRIGLIARIGLDRVEALENNNEPHKWTREELREIIATYKAKAKDLTS